MCHTCVTDRNAHFEFRPRRVVDRMEEEEEEKKKKNQYENDQAWSRHMYIVQVHTRDARKIYLRTCPP